MQTREIHEELKKAGFAEYDNVTLQTALDSARLLVVKTDRLTKDGCLRVREFSREDGYPMSDVYAIHPEQLREIPARYQKIIGQAS